MICSVSPSYLSWSLCALFKNFAGRVSESKALILQCSPDLSWPARRSDGRSEKTRTVCTCVQFVEIIMIRSEYRRRERWANAREHWRSVQRLWCERTWRPVNAQVSNAGVRSISWWPEDVECVFCIPVIKRRVRGCLPVRVMIVCWIAFFQRREYLFVVLRQLSVLLWVQ